MPHGFDDRRCAPGQRRDQGLSGDGGARAPGRRRDSGMVGSQRPDLRRRRPVRPLRLQRAGARSLPGPRYHDTGRGQSSDGRSRLPRCDAPGSARCRASFEGTERQGRGHGLLHGRRPDHRRRGAYPRGHRGGVLLRHPAQGFCRPGQDPRAVPGAFRQPGRLVHAGRGRRSRTDAEAQPASATRSIATTPPMLLPTSAAPPTTSPAPIRPGTGCRPS